ncbi:hypothetical protein BB561_005915 [Smittium simulii]|uniref:Ubiquitin fusion degradation protein UFD1 N-terminal subdomain 1 domain-containing protein n=1 Tax=Smittium simulii TaxID=133385 RepID=A0A2T9Y7L3_9FUNG|nr:hypothetical protein BB561_005915 [Smittium simulii]
MQTNTTYTKKLQCYTLQDESILSDKLFAPQSLLSEIIDFFKNNTHSVEQINLEECPTFSHKKNSFSSPKSRFSSNTAQKKQLVSSKRKGNTFSASLTNQASISESSVVHKNNHSVIHNSQEALPLSAIQESDYSSTEEILESKIYSSTNTAPNFHTLTKKEFELIPSPLTFEISKLSSTFNDTPSNNSFDKLCVGIKEFSSAEGTLGVPKWLMEQLKLSDNDIVLLSYIKLPKASFAQFMLLEPIKISVNTDIRSIMESFIRKNLTTLTEGQIVTITSEGFRYIFQASKLQPASKVDLIDTDLSVDILISAQSDQQDNSNSASNDIEQYTIITLGLADEGHLVQSDTTWFVFDFNELKRSYKNNSIAEKKIKFSIFDTTNNIGKY